MLVKNPNGEKSYWYFIAANMNLGKGTTKVSGVLFTKSVARRAKLPYIVSLSCTLAKVNSKASSIPF